MLTSWRARAIAGAVVFGVVLGGVYLFSTPAVPIDTVTTSKGALEVTVDEEGVSRIRHVYSVSAPVSGQVQRSPLQVGDLVKANSTIVARITPKAPDFLDERAQLAATARVRAMEAALKYARATVNKAKAELAFAYEDLSRAKKLMARQTVSQRARDQAVLRVKTRTAALENAHADVEVKRYELRVARAQLIQPTSGIDANGVECCVNVLAPVSGRVLKILVESAQVVSAGATLLEIGDPTDLEIVVDLLSTDAVRVAPGAQAYVERWGSTAVLMSRVRRIEPAGFKDVSALGIEEQRVKVRLDFQGPQERYARLGHDFRVFVRIVTWRDKNTLRVPISALFRKGQDWAVFVSAGGAAKQRIIRIGHRNDTYAQVLAGLAEGEHVILHPSDRIKDGTPVVERSTLN